MDCSVPLLWLVGYILMCGHNTVLFCSYGKYDHQDWCSHKVSYMYVVNLCIFFWIVIKVVGCVSIHISYLDIYILRGY